MAVLVKYPVGITPGLKPRGNKDTWAGRRLEPPKEVPEVPEGPRARPPAGRSGPPLVDSQTPGLELRPRGPADRPWRSVLPLVTRCRGRLGPAGTRRVPHPYTQWYPTHHTPVPVHPPTTPGYPPTLLPVHGPRMRCRVAAQQSRLWA